MDKLGKYIKAAADASSNINVFYAIIGALENGTISGSASASKTSDKIIKLCKEEARRQLGIMDDAIEAAHGIKGDV